MIARLTGTVIDRLERTLIVDVGGVGYEVAAPTALKERLLVGATATFYTYHHVSADQETLFGFSDAQELQYFKLLLTVPSVGPRTALNILDVAPPALLAQAVSTGDHKLLTKVSGVGRKTAERILVELREKFKHVVVVSASGTIQQEAIAALVSIGFSTAQAREAVQNLPQDVTTVEQAVREVLKQK
jgi:Holliday junction DNA helicase RuvA